MWNIYFMVVGTLQRPLPWNSDETQAFDLKYQELFIILVSVLAYAICMLWIETVCLKIVDALSIQTCDKESRLFIQATEIYSYCQDDTYKSSHVKFNGQVQYYQHFYHVTQLFPSVSQMDPIIYVDHMTILIGNLF